MAAAHRDERRPQARRIRPKVLSLTKYIPYPSVTHAGGEYLLAHDRALQRFAEVENLAPDTPINRDALPRARAYASGESSGPPASLIEGARLGAGGIGGPLFALWQLESVWAGSSIYRPVRRLFRGGRAPWSELAAADVVEFQWSEMIALAPLVRRRLPAQKLVGVAHDVITQRWDRLVDAGGGSGGGSAILRPLHRLAAARSRRREAATFSALDLLVVFSEKDAELARELAPGTRVEVVHPGLGPTDPMTREPRVDEPEVLFTGALNRPENWRAVLWFIDEMWGRVLAEVPQARLVIAGANPPEALLARVAQTPRAELTGFVDSLEPWYARASVFAVPLQTGAGVKFKTIDAMLRGVPIVTTTVGAEGIGSAPADAGEAGADDDASELFAAVTDDARDFADAVVRQLRSPDTELTARAQRWADGVYGVEAFERRIRELYDSLIVD